MSHVATIELHILSLDELSAACKQLGLELCIGQKKFRWYGRSVGDHPLPEGFTESDLGRCEHAIRIPGNGAAYEVGVVRRRDGKPGFTLMWDFWQGGYGLQEAIGSDGNKIRQEYACAVAARASRKMGLRVSRTMTADGKIVLKARR